MVLPAQFLRRREKEISILVKLHAKRVEKPPTSVDDSISMRSKQLLLEQAIENGDYDIVIKKDSADTAEVKIRVHKSILAAGSPVFQAMLAHEGNKEVQEGRLVILEKDFAESVVRVFVEFLYCEKLLKSGLSGGEIAEVLAIADKFQVVPLKVMIIL